MPERRNATPQPPANGAAVQVVRRQLGNALLGLGLFLVVLGAKPEWFHLSLSPAIGLLQLLTFLTGLGLATFGAYLRILAAWHANGPLPTRADLGVRVAATGYVLAAVAALADILGLGSHPNPYAAYFGPWQRAGLALGIVVLLLGFAFAVPWKFSKEVSPNERAHRGDQP